MIPLLQCASAVFTAALLIRKCGCATGRTFHRNLRSSSGSSGSPGSLADTGKDVLHIGQRLNITIVFATMAYGTTYRLLMDRVTVELELDLIKVRMIDIYLYFEIIAVFITRRPVTYCLSILIRGRLLITRLIDLRLTAGHSREGDDIRVFIPPVLRGRSDECYTPCLAEHADRRCIRMGLYDDLTTVCP